MNGNSSALATTCSSYSELGDKASSKVKAHGKAHWPLKHAAQGNPQAQKHHLECQVHGQHQMFDPSIKTKDSLLGQAPSDFELGDTPHPEASLRPNPRHPPEADCPSARPQCSLKEAKLARDKQTPSESQREASPACFVIRTPFTGLRKRSRTVSSLPNALAPEHGESRR